MSADANPARAARKACRWVWAGLGVFVVAAAGIWWWGFGGQSRAAYDEVLARAKAAGFALRVEDLPEWDVPAEEDCTAEVEAAWADVRRRGTPGEDDVTGPWDYNLEEPWYEHASPERMDALRAWLSENEQVFVDLDAALARRVLRVDVAVPGRAQRVSRAHTVLLGDVLSVQDLLESSMFADRDAARRLRAAASVLRLGDRMLPDRFIVTAIGWRSSRVGLHGMLRELALAETPAAELRDALDRCRLRERIPTWHAFVRGEIAGIAEDARPVRAISSADRERLKSAGIEFPEIPDITWPMIARDFDYCLRLHDIPTSDYVRAQGEMRALLARVLPATTAQHTPQSLVHERFARQDAALRLLRLALAATVRRERDGRWPASLAELAPDFGGAVPVDPTTNTAFTYEVTGETMRVAIPADSALRVYVDGSDVPSDELIESGLVISVTR